MGPPLVVEQRAKSLWCVDHQRLPAGRASGGTAKEIDPDIVATPCALEQPAREANDCHACTPVARAPNAAGPWSPFRCRTAQRGCDWGSAKAGRQCGSGLARPRSDAGLWTGLRHSRERTGHSGVRQCGWLRSMTSTNSYPQGRRAPLYGTVGGRHEEVLPCSPGNGSVMAASDAQFAFPRQPSCCYSCPPFWH
jgi:hypothetical protein